MDFINHATQGFIAHYLIGFPFGEHAALIFGITGAIIGAYPDVVGECFAVFHDDGYEMYNDFHKGEHNQQLKWIPAWGLHTWQDSFLHDVGKRWWVLEERAWYEMLSWFINLIVLACIILI